MRGPRSPGESRATPRLRNLLEGAALQSACEGNPAELEAARAAWAKWSEAEPELLGAAIEKVVVETLEAPHLKPSGIEKRLNEGLAASRFGLFTLMRHI